jgi:hypothetical protein
VQNDAFYLPGKRLFGADIDPINSSFFRASNFHPGLPTALFAEMCKHTLPDECANNITVLKS